MIFCKIFNDDQGNQILVVNDVNEEGKPSISVSIVPDGLGVCTMRLGYEDSEDGWNKCDKAFDEFNKETAVLVRNQIVSGSRGFQL